MLGDESVGLGGPGLVIDRRAEHDRVVGVERLDLVDASKVGGGAGRGDARRDARGDALGCSVAAGVDDEHGHGARIAPGDQAGIRGTPHARTALFRGASSRSRHVRGEPQSLVDRLIHSRRPATEPKVPLSGERRSVALNLRGELGRDDPAPKTTPCQTSRQAGSHLSGPPAERLPSPPPRREPFAFFANALTKAEPARSTSRGTEARLNGKARRHPHCPLALERPSSAPKRRGPFALLGAADFPKLRARRPLQPGAATIDARIGQNFRLLERKRKRGPRRCLVESARYEVAHPMGIVTPWPWASRCSAPRA